MHLGRVAAEQGLQPALPSRQASNFFCGVFCSAKAMPLHYKIHHKKTTTKSPAARQIKIMLNTQLINLCLVIVVTSPLNIYIKMVKTIVANLLVCVALLPTACAQKNIKPASNIAYAKNNNSLLWEITGKGLKQPSYLFGTIHLICKDDAVLSAALKTIIATVDKIYFEINMDNMMMEALSMMSKMNMKNGNTLKTLLNDKDYTMVKKYFTEKNAMLPFSMVEKMKPLFSQSLLAKDGMDCDGTDGMEMKIMAENKNNANKKETAGLETAAYQMSIFDSIPDKEQADALVKSITATVNGNKNDDKESMASLTKLYKAQNLDSIVSMMNADKDALTFKYADAMLYRRNSNWIPVIEKVIKDKTALFAVGAAHLGGPGGVIDLLKKAGYTVKAIKNNMNPAM